MHYKVGFFHNFTKILNIIINLNYKQRNYISSSKINPIFKDTSMLKQLLPIFIAFVLGWVLHVVYSLNDKQNNQPVEIDNLAYLSCLKELQGLEPEIIEKTIIKEVVKYLPTAKVENKEKNTTMKVTELLEDQFLLALKKEEFNDAMSYYEEADEEKHPVYQSALLTYFSKKQNSNPLQAIEQMQEFLEIEPDSEAIVFKLAGLFEKLNQYELALNLMVEFSYATSYDNIRTLHRKIKNLSNNYITKLETSDSIQDLITFLKNRINIGVLMEFYSFELAKAYLEIKKYTESMEVLTPLTLNDEYKERSLELLAFIQTQIDTQGEYQIEIPLIRDGVHFLVHAYVQNTPVLLLLDTGASTTSIDHNLVSHLPVLRKNVLFHTAGGEIYSSTYSAESFSVGSITLENFKVSANLYPDKDFHGLLGMNFLSRFKFKIDQKNAILFLGKKEN